MRNLLIPCILFILTGCSFEPEPINYGSDQCSYCKMNIVDQQHAAQYVTSKGKQFKFDAIECMVYKIIENKDLEYAHQVVCAYDSPATMIPAEGASFLISQGIRSPMGAYLSAFSDLKKAEEMRSKHGGKLYTWTEIQAYFNEN